MPWCSSDKTTYRDDHVNHFQRGQIVLGSLLKVCKEHGENLLRRVDVLLVLVVQLYGMLREAVLCKPLTQIRAVMQFTRVLRLIRHLSSEEILRYANN